MAKAIPIPITQIPAANIDTTGFNASQLKLKSKLDKIIAALGANAQNYEQQAAAYGTRRGWEQTSRDYSNLAAQRWAKIKDIQSTLPEILSKASDPNLSSTELNLLAAAAGKGADETGGLDENQARMAQEAYNEYTGNKEQSLKSEKQLSDFRNQAETQMFGGTGLSLSDALSSTGGDLGELNRFLGRQEAETFNTQLKPLIQMSLGAQGLSDSGAAVELQSKALAQLEQAKQQNMMQAALGARANLQGLKRSDILGGIGQAHENLTNTFDLNRMGITMRFQQELERQREQLARELSNQGSRRGFNLGSALGMGLGAIGGGMIGGPAGAMAGAGLGGSFGGYFGGGGQDEPNYGALMDFGSMMPTKWPNFFQNSYQGAGLIGGSKLNLGGYRR